MKAYRIQNDIVAAADEQQAIAAWSELYHAAPTSAGPVEEVSPEMEISIENEDGSNRSGKISEMLPPDGSPAEVIACGECPNCD